MLAHVHVRQFEDVLQDEEHEKGHERYQLCLHGPPIDVLKNGLFLLQCLLNLLEAEDKDDDEVQAHHYKTAVLYNSSLKLRALAKVDSD